MQQANVTICFELKHSSGEYCSIGAVMQLSKWSSSPARCLDFIKIHVTGYCTSLQWVISGTNPLVARSHLCELQRMAYFLILQYEFPIGTNIVCVLVWLVVGSCSVAKAISDLTT